VNIFLAFLVAALTAFDCWLTIRRVHKYSEAIELNAPLKYVAKHIGWRGALILLIFVPNTALAFLWVALNWGRALAFFAGLRTTLFIFQVGSLRAEDAIVEALGFKKRSGP